MAQYIKVWKDEFRGKLFLNFINKFIKNTKSSISLDVGCRYGAFTFELAKNFKKVVGIDINEEIIEDFKKRAQYIKNLEVFTENILNTNFSDNTFDLVILEGVFEWIGCSDPSRSPKNSQKQAIRECFRILKKGGILYIGIENKFFPYHIWKDPHGFTPLTALLPKFVSIPLYRKITKGKYYGQNVLGYSGYIKMMNEVFKNCQILIPLPTYKYLFAVSSFNGKELRNKIREVLNNKAINKSYKIILKLLFLASYFKLTKVFAKDFVILCRKEF